MKVILDHRSEVANGICTFWFRVDSKPHHIAGQFIELRIPHENKDKRGDKRWFTLSSSPSEPLLSITTKLAPKDGSSFKSALRSLEPGTELNMATPMGDFVLPKDATIPLVFVAGGIDATPFRSICKYLLDSGESRQINIIYNAHSDEEVAFRDVFESFGEKFKTVIDERLTAEKILDIAGGDDDQYIYISGPEPMIESLNKDLRNAGVNKKHIHTDFSLGI